MSWIKMGSRKSSHKSLFEMSRNEAIELIKDTRFCLNCGKAISYEVLHSHFCWVCNMNYQKQIRVFEKKYGL